MKDKLNEMSDTVFYYFLQTLFEDRKFEWGESTNNYGEATVEAKLAVIKHILCS